MSINCDLTKTLDDHLADIRLWDWKYIAKVANTDIFFDNDGDQFIGSAWLGTIFGICPSGKFYMPFACSNVTEEEALQDELFYEALDTVAEENGLFIWHWDESIFAQKCFDIDDIDLSKQTFITADDYETYLEMKRSNDMPYSGSSEVSE
jgi:hypothetical protein